MSTTSILDALLAQGRQALQGGDPAAARRAYQQATLLEPSSAEIVLDLAAACLADRDPAEALRQARQVAGQQGGWRIESIQATATRQLGQMDAAALHLQRVLHDPRLPGGIRSSSLLQLADLQLNVFGDARASAQTLDQAAEISARPEDILQAGLGTLIADLYEGGRSSRAISDGFVALGERLMSLMPLPTLAAPPRRAPRARLRIGVLSQQFCASPVGFLTLGTLRELSRHAELVFFDRGVKQDWAHAAFRACARHWLPCAALDAAQMQQLLVRAELDALIDLSGWTDLTALRAVASRPVPRQIKWVGGQSATTGLRCFDGMVTDARQTPTAAASLYTEPLLRAQHGYVGYHPPPYMPGLAAAAARVPTPRGRPAPGVVALVSHPAKISAETVRLVERLKPRKLWLVDLRWKHAGTRHAAGRRLGSLLDVAEFATPANHLEYLQTLQALDARFIDTVPYSMGLTAVELRLLGKHILTWPRSPVAPMSQRHGVAHVAAQRFDHHAALAHQLLQWCKGAT